MIPAGLRFALDEELARLTKAASALGARLAIDPERLLQRDIVLSPPGLWSANRHCRMVQTLDGWIAVNLARPDDRNAVAAWLECEVTGDWWEAIVRETRARAAAGMVERATLLGLPVARVGETSNRAVAHALHDAPSPAVDRSAKVIDLSALWAGPLCGGLLAEAGFPVIKVEDPARPDPTPKSMPKLDGWLNGRKERKTWPLASPELLDEIGSARVLITSGRAAALARAGLTPDAVFERNPSLLWIAITAHGFDGPGALRVGFGDDCAAAGGLIGHEDGKPRFLGDAIADPLTGLCAARLALEHLASGKAGLVDVPLASTAARFAEAMALA